MWPLSPHQDAARIHSADQANLTHDCREQSKKCSGTEISYRSADFPPALPDTCSLSPKLCPPSKSYDCTQAMKIRSSGRAVFKIFQMNKQYFLTRMTRNRGRNRSLAFAQHSQSFMQHFASALGSKLHSKGS